MWKFSHLTSILNGKEEISYFFDHFWCNYLQFNKSIAYKTDATCVITYVLYFYDVPIPLKGPSTPDLQKDCIFSLFFVLTWKYLFRKYVNGLVPSV